MEQILNAPQRIPEGILDQANCVLIVPSVQKFAVGIGGSYGKTNPNPSLFLMFTSEKSDLVIGGQDVPEMSDLYRVTLDRRG